VTSSAAGGVFPPRSFGSARRVGDALSPDMMMSKVLFSAIILLALSDRHNVVDTSYMQCDANCKYDILKEFATIHFGLKAGQTGPAYL
jgi:hypothetical protein